MIILHVLYDEVEFYNSYSQLDPYLDKSLERYRELVRKYVLNNPDTYNNDNIAYKK